MVSLFVYGSKGILECFSCVVGSVERLKRSIPLAECSVYFPAG